MPNSKKAALWRPFARLIVNVWQLFGGPDAIDPVFDMRRDRHLGPVATLAAILGASLAFAVLYLHVALRGLGSVSWSCVFICFSATTLLFVGHVRLRQNATSAQRCRIGDRVLGNGGFGTNAPLEPLRSFARYGPLSQIYVLIDLFAADGPEPVSLESASERANDLLY